MSDITGYFVWEVRGSYDSSDAMTERKKDILKQDFSITNKRTDFDCMVLTHDPMGRDVATMALNLRIGDESYAEDANTVIDLMECLGYAANVKEEK